MSPGFRRVLPRQSFLASVDCPHCTRSHTVRGTAPIGEGHRPHYFACECGRKIMAVVPAGAEIALVQAARMRAAHSEAEPG